MLKSYDVDQLNCGKESEVPVLLATLTAPLEPVVCSAPVVVDPVGAEKDEDTGPEIAALVVVP